MARSLFAFAHPVRLCVLRELVSAADGLPAGELARRIGVKQSTLSAHFSLLEQQGLVFGQRQGRQIIYRADAITVRHVVEKLRKLLPA